MKIEGMQKLTLLDFPGRVAATVFTPGCDMRCPFCHNAELVVGGPGGDALVSIIQLTPIRVRFSVSNREVLDVFGGDVAARRDAAEMSVSLANGTALGEKGVIEYAENAADSFTDTLTLYSLFENASRALVPGGTVAVTLASKDGVMRPAVPASAVLQDTQGPYVWVVGADSKAERRSIARGDLDDGFVFVEKGLEKGERVVADGAHKVRRGMTVEAAK